jgi:hypothetical protein
MQISATVGSQTEDIGRKKEVFKTGVILDNA